ncbi:MAG: cupin domain-containing protein [Burkholderiales bacterium]|nr:cupin domain-containing protein [Burkholderiales bacterium]
MPFKIRRIVTSHDERGRAVVGADSWLEAAPGVMDKNLGNCWLWSTDSMPADAFGSDPVLPGVKPALHPKPHGTVFRIVEFPAGAPAVMHKTDTVDYAIVLSGEIDMILDDGAEVHMNTGDVMVQRATYHGWLNRGDKPCRIAFVLIDSKP